MTTRGKRWCSLASGRGATSAHKFGLQHAPGGKRMAADPCLVSEAVKDPHLNFAYGGHADFRGRHNALFNFLSTPRLSVNVKTEESLFHLVDGEGRFRTINGTFLTEAHLVAQIHRSGVLAKVSFWASEVNENNWGYQVGSIPRPVARFRAHTFCCTGPCTLTASGDQRHVRRRAH